MNAPTPSIQSPLSAATLTLIGAVACVAAFLPPLNERVLGSPLIIAAVALALSAFLVLHLAFVGILATRLGRKVWIWVLLALVTFPLGPIVGLALLYWQVNEAAAA